MEGLLKLPLLPENHDCQWLRHGQRELQVILFIFLIKCNQNGISQKFWAFAEFVKMQQNEANSLM